jgi:hypothetical protein
VGPDTDRIKIEFEVSPPGKIYVAGMSCRVAALGGQAR